MRARPVAITLVAGLVAALSAAGEAEAQGMRGMHGHRGMHAHHGGHGHPGVMHGGCPMAPAWVGGVETPSPGTADTGQSAPTADAARGHRVYEARCASCHGSDPSRDGPVGPALMGSARDLLTARVLFAAYPRGYTPKRRTWIMPAQPDLRPSVGDLAAYLRER